MNFTPQSQVQGFKPLQVKGTEGAQQAEANRQRSYDNEYLNSVISANQQKVANAEQRAKDMVALGELSSTLLKQGTEVLQQINQEREANRTFDALFGDANATVSTPQEVEEDKELNELSNATTEAAQEIEQNTGSAVLGDAVATQSPGGQVATAYNNQRASLAMAQIGYGSFVNSYLNSDATITVGGQSMPIRAAMASGDPALTSAALASARGAFYRSYGLDRFSQRQVVRVLGNTILNTDNQLLTSYTNEAIKTRREEAKQQIQSQSYLAGQEGSNLGGSFRSLADTAYASGGYTSRGAANEDVLKGMLRGLVANGDVDGINQLAGEEKIEGNPGSTLGRQYPEQFDAAREQAEKAQEALISGNIEDIQAGMYRDLASATTKEQKDQIIEAAASALEAQGSDEEARKLRQQRDDLVVDGAADYNASRLEAGIRSGEIRSASQINQEEALGNISPERAKELRGMLTVSNGAEKPKDPTAAAITKDFVKGAQSDVLQALGLKRDQFGNIAVIDNRSQFSASDGILITGQVERDINLLVNDVIRSNPGITNDPLRLQATIAKELKEWKQDNLLTAGGKYSIVGFRQSQTGKANDEGVKAAVAADTKNFESLLDDPSRLVAPRIPAGSRAQPLNLSGIVRSPGGLTPHMARNFNPLRNDVLFNQDDVVKLREEMANGTTSALLEQTADAVGMSPRAVLQQQSNIYGLGPVPQPKIEDTPNPTAAQGMKMLESLGVPSRGAAWLAGNIQAESAWRGQRPSWVLDDGAGRNGGLLSWNRGRLANLEARYGKPVQQISTRQQLEFLLDELKKYPEAYRIFMNPMATDRMLIRASKLFIGYDDINYDQSHRYNTARGLAARG